MDKRTFGKECLFYLQNRPNSLHPTIWAHLHPKLRGYDRTPQAPVLTTDHATAPTRALEHRSTVVTTCNLSFLSLLCSIRLLLVLIRHRAAKCCHLQLGLRDDQPVCCEQLSEPSRCCPDAVAQEQTSILSTLGTPASHRCQIRALC